MSACRLNGRAVRVGAQRGGAADARFRRPVGDGAQLAEEEPGVLGACQGIFGEAALNEGLQGARDLDAEVGELLRVRVSQGDRQSQRNVRDPPFLGLQTAG